MFLLAFPYATQLMKLIIPQGLPKMKKDLVMIAGWPGWGNVGIETITWFREQTAAVEFAHIDLSDELLPETVTIENGILVTADLPQTKAYYSASANLLLVQGDTQVQGTVALSLIRGVLELAQKCGVSKIYTAASASILKSFDEPIEVMVSTTNQAMLRDLTDKGGIPFAGGQILGLNGVLLGFTSEYGIPSACAKATLPKYARNFPNPKSVIALVNFFSKVLGIEMKEEALDKDLATQDSMMQEIEERILRVVDMLLKDEETTSLGNFRLPSPVDRSLETKIALTKIEDMFEELSRNRSKELGTRLKNELDRHDLYDLYEDRFLDLFKDEEL